MFSRRVSFARACGEDLTRVVVDGNLKLSGRICGQVRGAQSLRGLGVLRHSMLPRAL